MSKKLVIGLGSGRCGTTSLTKFLWMQRNASVSHEWGAATIGWYDAFAAVKLFVEEKLRQPYDIVGEVAFFLLPYVEYLITEFKDKAELYFICLKRDKYEVLSSFRKWQGWSPEVENRHPWYSGPGYAKRSGWDKCYPKFGFISQEDAASYYWDMYYDISDRLQSKYPTIFRLINIEALNTAQGQREILAFLQIDEEFMVTDENLPRLNKGK